MTARDKEDVVLAGRLIEHCLAWLRRNLVFCRDLPPEARPEQLHWQRGRDGFDRPALIMELAYIGYHATCWLRDPVRTGYRGATVFIRMTTDHRFRGCVKPNGEIEMEWG